MAKVSIIRNLFNFSRSAIFRKLSEFYALSRWKLFSAKNPVRTYSVPQAEQLQCSERRRQLLRRLLTRFPWWTRGHVLLGSEELLAIQISDDRPTPRSLAIIRVSAEAALHLTEPSSRLSNTDLTQVLEAKYLLAMVSYLKRDFDGALKYFHQILALNNVPYLSRKILPKALETGGTAAMATGNELLALEFFSRIPEDARSSDTRSAIAMIQSRNPGEHY